MNIERKEQTEDKIEILGRIKLVKLVALLEIACGVSDDGDEAEGEAAKPDKGKEVKEE